MGNQAGYGRQSVTGNRNTDRRKWNRQDNIKALECYYLSQLMKYGYMTRMYQIWKERRMFNITYQRIADQIKVIKRNDLMSELEMVEIKNRVLNLRPPTEIEDNTMVQDEQHTTLPEKEHATLQEEQEHSEVTPLARSEPTQQEKEIIGKLKEMMGNIETRRSMPRVKRIPKEKIRKEMSEVNRALELVETRDISQTNDLILAGAHLVLKRVKGNKPKEGTYSNHRMIKEPP